MSLDGSPQISFRRLTNPLVIPVSPVASRFDVPNGFFDMTQGINSFYAVNPNNFWVRLKGATTATQPYTDITETEGWLWGPGFQGVFTTQFPVWVSVIAVTRQGLPAGTGNIELAYGMGS